VAPLADTPALLAGLPAAKIPHFAAEAKALDAAEMRKITAPKRTMLLLCLLHQASVQGIDDLATMFCKRIATIHRRGREALEAVRVRHRAKTEALVTVLADVLGLVSDAPSDAEVGRRVRALLAPRGGTQPLLDNCAALAAYHGDNYLPLLWPLYRSHRPTLFRLARLLEFVPTSQDRSLVAALAWLLAHERKRGEWLDGHLDLSFAPERWQQALTPPVAQAGRLNRRLLEVCLFSCLADELRSGDVAIRGSDAYADYREQLLSREAGEPLPADYCRDLGFPATARASSSTSGSGSPPRRARWMLPTPQTGRSPSAPLGSQSCAVPRRARPRPPPQPWKRPCANGDRSGISWTSCVTWSIGPAGPGTSARSPAPIRSSRVPSSGTSSRRSPTAATWAPRRRPGTSGRCHTPHALFRQPAPRHRADTLGGDH